jgi:hypothetical protein
MPLAVAVVQVQMARLAVLAVRLVLPPPVLVVLAGKVLVAVAVAHLRL